MLRVACLGLALVGCGRFGFASHAGGSAGLRDGTGMPDDVGAPAADAMPDGSPMPLGCEVPSAGSVVCYSFEGNGSDGDGHDDATATAVSYATGRVGMGVRLDASSLVTATNKPILHLATAGTVAGWIDLDALPTGSARSVIVDTNSYGLAVLPGGDAQCFYTGTDHTFAGVVTAGTWTHLACAYDGSGMTLWKDGAVVATQADSGPVKNTVAGLQIGSNIPDPNHPNADTFVGMLDEVGIWSVALTTAEVCAAAGTCP